MVHKKTRLIISLLLVVICSLISLQGCSFLRKLQTPTDEQGISIGFQYENSQGSLITAIKSDKKVFDIDDVTLDFYYGGFTRDYSHCESVALYFLSKNKFDTEVDDYKNIDGCYFIKEISREEYDSGPFDIEQRWGPKQKEEKNNIYFHYIDTMTIPKEMFLGQTGMVAFFIAHIALNEEGNSKYRLIASSGQDLYYIIKEDGTVELRTIK